MTRAKYDVVVLGTGPSGASIAERCARAGLDVAIVEAREVGGTCALRGCNPKKVLVEAADLLDRVRRADGRLLRTRDARIDWRELTAFMREFTEPVPASSRASFEDAGATVHVAKPRFVGPVRLALDGDGDGDAPDEIEADQIVIAVGARPRTLAIDGAEHLTPSDEFLALRELPRRILFVGGGYVSFEFAHVTARAGAEVSVWHRGERPLAAFDAELVDALLERTRGLGVDVRLGAEVAALTRGPDGTLLARDAAGTSATFDLVVHGAGREPALDGLDLDVAEVAHHTDGVTVDAHLRSPSNPRVLAVGDCAATDAPALTPVANAHAHAVARNLIEGEDRHLPDVDGVAAVVFTVPSLARVGLDEDGAAAAGHAFEVRTGDWSRAGSVRKVIEPCARWKLLVERETDRVLGAHLLGPLAHEVIDLFVLALRAGLTTRDLKSAPLAFPTAGHDVRAMV